jgi:uncharacterized protein (TIGR02246 family)
MGRTLWATGLIAGLLVVVCWPVQSQTETKKQTKAAAEQKKAAPATGKSEAPAKAAADHSADEAEIRASVEAFAKAYNGHDAKATAELFAPNARVVTEEDEVVEGREAIEQVFAAVFANDPQTHIEIAISSIKFIGADLALEVGSTKTAHAPGETPEYGRYTVLHFKRDGKWLMGLARDTEGEPPTNHDHLLPLAWMIGEWIDESKESVVHTSCRWSDDKNFILQDIQVRMAGRAAMEVTQRIGWDPLSKRIRSWVFDSEGGFGDGVWARDGDAWIIKATFVPSHGRAASATNTIVPNGKDSYVWRSTDRVVGDEVQEPLEVTVVRKPPAPKK